MSSSHHRLTDPQLVAPLVDGLVARLSLHGGGEVPFTTTAYDTFDWRIWSRGGLLVHETTPAGSSLAWTDRASGSVTGRLDVAEVPRLPAELPVGPLRDRVADAADIRALLPLATISGSRRELRLLDDETKTTARLVVTRLDGPGGPSDPDGDVRLAVVPVRGYDGDTTVRDVLRAQFSVETVDHDPLVSAIHAVGREPGRYSSKLRLALDPGSSALAAWTTVLDALRVTIAENHQGTVDDLDSEFLHDLRVAVRRTRSVIGQARGVLPDPVRDRFKDDFAWLGRVTSPTRDLDVFLLDLPDLEAALPPSLVGSLGPLRTWLVEQQRAAHASMATELTSARYRAVMADWERYLADPRSEPSATSASDGYRPAPEVAGRRTWKAFRRVLRDGRLIDDSTPGERLHELRKDTKRLRYMVECFGSLFPADALAPTVASLKSLQDVLGRHQDGDVQGAALRSMADELQDDRDDHDDVAGTVLAMGSALSTVDERRRTARAEFAARFAELDTPDHRRQLRRVLVPGER
jgi:CHAD domain-containing protein